MTDKEPTQEQIKEFWEWCGIKHRPDLDFGEYYGRWHEVYEYPDRTPTDILPLLDLNNLFKYAVPKLDIENVTLHPATNNRWGCYFDGWYQDHNVGESPALALFWAIWEVIRK